MQPQDNLIRPNTHIPGICFHRMMSEERVIRQAMGDDGRTSGPCLFLKPLPKSEKEATKQKRIERLSEQERQYYKEKGNTIYRDGSVVALITAVTISMGLLSFGPVSLPMAAQCRAWQIRTADWARGLVQQGGPADLGATPAALNPVWTFSMSRPPSY